MDECHGGSAFTDRTADALHRAGAHIADRENAWNARFERRWCISFGEIGGVLSGEDEAMRVKRDAATLEPTCLGLRSHKKEYMTDRPLLFDAGLIVTPGHR